MPPYSAASAITGRGQSTVAQIDAFMAQQGRLLAPQYAPDGAYKAPPLLGAAIVAISGSLGVNHDLVTGQIVKETAAWQSRYARERNNPGGLGAINSNPDLAIRFPTPAAGIRAHVSHLATYVRGDGPWTADDPRYDATPVGWRGSVRRLSDLDGKWAYPGVGYGAGIAKLANQLLAVEVPTMAAQIPGFAWVPADARHYTKGRTKRIQGGAQHYTAGTNSLVWLTTSPNSDVSATCLVKHDPTMEDRGWQLVRIEDTAHTTGATINPITASIEYEQLEGQEIPDIAYEVLGATWADIERYVLANNLGDFSAGIKGHKTWVDDNRVCPDGIDMARVVERWQHYRAAPAPPADDALYLTYADGSKCPFPIVLGFRAWCESVGRVRNPTDINAGILSVTGYATTAEYVAKDGRTYQQFERLTLQFNANAAPPFDIVPILCGTPLPDKAA